LLLDGSNKAKIQRPKTKEQRPQVNLEGDLRPLLFGFWPLAFGLLDRSDRERTTLSLADSMRQVTPLISVPKITTTTGAAEGRHDRAAQRHVAGRGWSNSHPKSE
jgi:hypothetical protein